MDKKERREKRRRELEDREAEQSKIAHAHAELTSHHSLFDALPESLDSLLREHCKGRTWHPPSVKPSKSGYLHLIDERDVNDEEHDEVCRLLIGQLKAIVDWCHGRTIDLAAMADEAMEEIAEQHRNPHVTPEPDDETKCKSWLLDVVKDLAIGADDEALADLQGMGKTIPVSGTMWKICRRIDEFLQRTNSPPTAAKQVEIPLNIYEESEAVKHVETVVNAPAVEQDESVGKVPAAGAQHSKIVVPTNEDVARVVNLVANGMAVQTAAKEVAKKSEHSAGSLKTLYYVWKRNAQK